MGRGEETCLTSLLDKMVHADIVPSWTPVINVELCLRIRSSCHKLLACTTKMCSSGMVAVGGMVIAERDSVG